MNKKGYIKKRKKEHICHCCGVKTMFTWKCRCGFSICQNCMNENLWGVSCNGVTWQCPDCGEQNNLQ